MSKIQEIRTSLEADEYVLMWGVHNVVVFRVLRHLQEPGEVLITVLLDQWRPGTPKGHTWTVGASLDVVLQQFDNWDAMKIPEELIHNYSHIHLVTGIDLRPPSDEN